MTYSNIILKKHDRFGDGEKQSVIDPFLKSIIEKLALKYPQWTFEETACVNVGSTRSYEANRFNVLDKREVLGTIDKEYCSSGYRFCINNHRIDGMRERGRGMKTIHEDKAIKHVAKFFGKKDLTEKFTEASKKAQDTLSHIHNSKNWDLRHKWEGLTSYTQSYIYENYAHFASTITTADTRVRDSLEKLPNALAEYNSVDAMQNALRKGDATIVFIDGINYSVQKGKDPLEVKTSEELPEHMRKAVGLLKLVEDNQVIDGVGMRVDATTFLVYPNNVS